MIDEPEVLPKPLSIRHDHQHLEPSMGFAARLAAVNGRTMRDLLHDMRIDRRALANGVPHAVRRLAALGSVCEADLVSSSPRRSGPGKPNAIGEEILGPRAVHRTHFRFCPHCLQEDLDAFGGPAHGRPWLRLHWTVDSVRSCPRHGVFTVDTAVAGSRFEHFDFSRAIRSVLEDLPTLAAQATASPPSPFQDWLLRRLDGVRDPGNWLDHFPLYVGMEWCEALGLSALHPSRVRVSDLARRQLAEAADEGFRVSSLGGHGITDLLNTLNGGQRRTLGVWGLRDTFGPAYALLQKTAEDASFGPIRDLVRTFAIANVPMDPGTVVLGRAIDKPALATVRSIARSAGIHDNTARKLFEQKGLGRGGLEGGLTNHRVTVLVDQIDETFSRLNGSLFSSQIKREFQIPRTHLTALIAIGALPSLRLAGGGPSTKHRFARTDVARLMERLLEGAEEVPVPTPRQLTIWDARAAACTSLENVLSMILDRRLAWKGRLAARSDYASVLVDADEIIGLVRVEPPRDGLTAGEAAVFIPGLKAESIPRLIEAGALSTTAEFSPQARRKVRVIPRSSALAFMRRYTTLGEFCRQHGFNAKRGEAMLRRLGVPTAFDPTAILAFVYERSSVEAAVTGSLAA
jgi:hypothetical protein